MALGFVGSTVDVMATVSKDPSLVSANIGFVRNIDTKSYGESYIWGVKAGNNVLLDALNQGITAAWQGGVIASAYSTAFIGANSTALTAPGPAAIGTSYGASEDYLMRSMWVTGPWLQRPDWVK
jgi:hypothetical protein